ncbi:MAG: hypothetical protein U1F43_02230 [Myxococcota bacterium]
MRRIAHALSLSLVLTAACGGDDVRTQDVDADGHGDIEVIPSDAACPAATISAAASCVTATIACFDPAGLCDYDQATQTSTFANGAKVHADAQALRVIFSASDGHECFRLQPTSETAYVITDSVSAAVYGWEQADAPCVDLVCPDQSAWVLDLVELGTAAGWPWGSYCGP